MADETADRYPISDLLEKVVRVLAAETAILDKRAAAEGFLPDLLSNAGHALDTIYFQSLRDRRVLRGNTSKLVSIEVDADTLTITDSGVGMTKADLINNLGTLAKIDEPEFQAALGASDASRMLSLGAGLYSSFVAATSIEVHTK